MRVPVIIFAALLGIIMIGSPCYAEQLNSKNLSAMRARIIALLPQYTSFLSAERLKRSKTLCIIHANDVYQELSKSTNLNSALQLVQDDSTYDTKKCQFTYVGDKKVAQHFLLEDAESRHSTFYISDYERFVDEGGALALVEKAGRIEVYINLTAAKNVGVQFSPDLIEISQRVLQ